MSIRIVNNILFLWVILALNVSSCRKKIATDTTLERTSALGEKFKNVLVSSPQGWLVCIENTEGLHYNFYMQFTEGGRVKMKADFSEETIALKESSYAIKLLQQPTLSFNTYNYISLLSDPDLGNPAGRGLRTDFEYAVSAELVELLQSTVSVTEVKHFTLEGILYQSKITFIRTNAEGEKSIDETFNIQKLIQSLKWNNGKTVPVLQFTGESIQYHYSLREGSKLLAVTSLETDKKATLLNYFFDVCGGGGVAMQLEARKGATAAFQNADLTTQFEKYTFTNFTVNADTTKISFDCNNGGSVKKGTLSAIAITSLSKDKVANKKDFEAFRTRNNFNFASITENGKWDAWNLKQGGAVSLEFLKFAPRGSSPLTFSLNYLDLIRNGIVKSLIFWINYVWLESTSDLEFLALFEPVQNKKGALWTFNYEQGRNEESTDTDNTQYLSDQNKQNVINKIYTNNVNDPPSTTGTENIFFILSTALGYELHNPSKNLFIALDF